MVNFLRGHSCSLALEFKRWYCADSGLIICLEPTFRISPTVMEDFGKFINNFVTNGFVSHWSQELFRARGK